MLARLRAEGPLTATQLGGAKNGGAWWDWSDTKIAVEWLLDMGEVICVRRDGWRRVYDLPERVLPGGLLADEPTDAECLAHLAASAARSLGVVTRADLIDYHRLRELTSPGVRHADLVDEAAEAAGLMPVAVDPAAAAGRTSPAPARTGITMGWADPVALARARGRRGPAPGHAAVPVRLAGLGPQAHPADVRLRPQAGGLRAAGQAGPRLLHDAAAGRRPARRPGGPGAAGADPRRPPAVTDLGGRRAPMARALREAAGWVGCAAVVAERVDPPQLAPRLRSALA